MDLDVVQSSQTTEVGSYFVANYPPFSAWSAEHLPAVMSALDAPAAATRNGRQPAPLGLYLHIPFCRKRCKFCYFRVYTDKNSGDVDVYLNALAREAALYAERAALKGRQFEFVYFGGGTPSFLSNEQLTRLIDRVSEHWLWENAREVTFECEPGTLKKHKLETIKAIGTTRLSLGVEHFDDEILTLNGRAHKSPEIFAAYDWAREVGFKQINIDLIAGMLGETELKWKETVDQALALQPDSITIYQMELPHNTVISQESKSTGGVSLIAGWETKRAWVDHAFRVFEEAGYVVSSGYTLAKPTPPVPPLAGGGEVMSPPLARGGQAMSHPLARGGEGGFVYRDAIWHGADMIGTGVASFSHASGVHFQNIDSWEGYVGALLDRNELPIARALPITDHQRLIRELVLQLKLGRIDAGYFRGKFGVEIADAFGEAFQSLIDDGFAAIDGDDIRLTRPGLLQVDGLLPRFYEPRFQNVRYT